MSIAGHFFPSFSYRAEPAKLPMISLPTASSPMRTLRPPSIPPLFHKEPSILSFCSMTCSPSLRSTLTNNSSFFMRSHPFPLSLSPSSCPSFSINSLSWFPSPSSSMDCTATSLSTSLSESPSPPPFVLSHVLATTVDLEDWICPLCLDLPSMLCPVDSPHSLDATCQEFGEALFRKLSHQQRSESDEPYMDDEVNKPDTQVYLGYLDVVTCGQGCSNHRICRDCMVRWIRAQIQQPVVICPVCRSGQVCSESIRRALLALPPLSLHTVQLTVRSCNNTAKPRFGGARRVIEIPTDAMNNSSEVVVSVWRACSDLGNDVATTLMGEMQPVASGRLTDVMLWSKYQSLTKLGLGQTGGLSAAGEDHALDLAAHGLQRCPGCAMAVERTGQLDDILCRCGSRFCFLCGEPLSRGSLWSLLTHKRSCRGLHTGGNMDGSAGRSTPRYF